MREDYLRRTGERNKNWPTSENTLESWWLWPVCMTHAVWSDTRICNLFLKQILLFCIPYLKTSNKTLTFSVKVALDEKKLLICMPISKEFSFIFFNQFKKGKCLPTLVSRERERDLWLFLGKEDFFFSWLYPFISLCLYPFQRRQHRWPPDQQDHRNHSCWKAARKVSSPTSCWKEGQQ